MGSSAKKKKEKRQDFQKAKLKVGKAKQKADNFTDTTFKAKSIALKKQSLSQEAPSLHALVAHHTALLRSRADHQRADSLAFLTNLPAAELADAATELLPKLPTLITDPSAAVRQALLKLLRRLPVPAVAAQADALLAWAKAGLTHISADIRTHALDVLDWMLDVAPDVTVGSRGMWYGILAALVAVLGWQAAVERGGWTQQQRPAGPLGAEGKAQARQLQTLAAFLRAGLDERPGGGEPPAFPYVVLAQHALPAAPNAYAHLALFGAPADAAAAAYEHREDRRAVFAEHFEPAVARGAEAARRAGGELGRAAAALHKALAAAVE